MADTLSSSPLMIALAFFSSSSRYPSRTNPSVVISMNFGFSFRDWDCSMDFAITFSAISWISSRIAKSMFRPSLFLVRSESLKILLFVPLLRMYR